jgi:uncharacterized protein (TIGR02145 family)
MNRKKIKTVISLFTAVLFTQLNYSQTVTIGTQVWMTKNLDIDKFRNGDPIPEAKTEEEWKIAGENHQPAWCYYNNNPLNGEKFGKLYNWYAVNDPRGLAPLGYHIPTELEFFNLINYIGTTTSREIMNKSGYVGEYKKYISLDNKINFENSGYRDCFGNFSLFMLGFWWTVSENNFSEACGFTIDLGQVSKFNQSKVSGRSVRCLKN